MFGVVGVSNDKRLGGGWVAVLAALAACAQAPPATSTQARAIGEACGDGLCHLQETHAACPQDCAADLDGDGLAEGVDPDPRRADADHDGIPDGVELSWGLDPLAPADAAGDLDGDGATNRAEYLGGSDALSAASLPAGAPFATMSPTDAHPTIALTPDGLGVGYTDWPTRGVRSTVGIQPGSGFFYFEAHRNYDPQDYGFGVVSAAHPLDQYGGASDQGIGVNTLGTCWSNGNNAGSFPSAADTHGVAVDYRGNYPVFYLITADAPGGAAALRVTHALTAIHTPLYIYAFGHQTFGGELHRLNAGASPFAYDARAALAAAGVPGASELRLGWYVPAPRVANAPPVLTVDALGGPVGVGLPVTLTARATDDLGELTASIQWIEFGSGATGTGATFTFTPAGSGVHSVLVTVRDADGLLDTVIVPVTVGTATDDDHDGLLTADELARGTDPANPDTDGDGLGDGQEVNVVHTDPLVADTDGDRLSDGWEVSHGFAPLSAADGRADPDHDRFSTGVEVTYGSDPNAAASDPRAAVRLSATDHGTPMTISADGLTPLFGTMDQRSARSNHPVQPGSGLYYFEVRRGIAADFFGGGVGSASADVEGPAGNSAQSFGANFSGIIWANGGGVAMFALGGEDTMGFAVDYRGATPTVHVIAAGAVAHTQALAEVTGPLYLMMTGAYRNPGGVQEVLNAGGDLAGHPFRWDAPAILTAAGVAGASELYLGWTPVLPDVAPGPVDQDGDGLDDAAEALRGTNPLLADTDGDGVSDGDEVHAYGTQPLLADTDGDGMLDGAEILNGLDPLAADATADADGDGADNASELAAGTDPHDPLSPPPYVEACGNGLCGDAETVTACPGDCRLRAQGLAAGPWHTCALLEDNTTRCWGDNHDGGLGIEDSSDTRSIGLGDLLPRANLGSGRTARELAAGDAFSCARLDDGSIKCWGLNGSGQLGVGDTSAHGDEPREMGDLLPPVRLGTGRTARAIAAGSQHACAILDDGSVKCWGDNDYGQLGQGDVRPRGVSPADLGDALPPVALGTGRTATALALGATFTCALLDDGSVKCWGNALAALRGDEPNEMGDALPALSLGTGRTAIAIAAGTGHACAILDNHAVKCWGTTRGGALGRGMTGNVTTSAQMGDALAPVDLGTGRTAIALGLGSGHSCALLDNHALKCWGDNRWRQLGYGDTLNRGNAASDMGDNLPAVDLGAGRTAQSVSGGLYYTCALLDDGTVRCWGLSTVPGSALATVELGSRHRCGNARLDAGEACDDGDARAGDGCNATCAIEPGWTCSGVFSDCASTCGDGIVAGREVCDDGNTTSGDGCSAGCLTEADLSVTAVTFAPPSAASGPGIFPVAATICNAGTQAVGGALQFRLVQNGVIDLLGSVLYPGLDFTADPIPPNSCEVRTSWVGMDQSLGHVAVAAFVTPGPSSIDPNPANDFAVSNTLAVLADLAVTNVEPSVVASPPGSVAMLVTVCNQGIVIGSADLSPRVSTDDVIDGTDATSESPVDVVLGPGACTQAVIAVGLESVDPSEYGAEGLVIGALLTPAQPDLDASNDRGRLPGRLPVMPDLAITALDPLPFLTLPQFVGGMATVCNNGNVNGWGRVSVRLSADAAITASDPRGDEVSVFLRPGICTQELVTANLASLAPRPFGPHVLGALVVPDFIDGLATNDSARYAGALAVGADVDVAAVRVDTVLPYGVRIEATLCNRGNLFASGTYSTRVSANAVIDAGDLRNAYNDLPFSLNPGGCSVYTGVIVLDPPLGVAGTFFVGTYASPNQPDLDESNNGRAVAGVQLTLPFDGCSVNHGGCSALATCAPAGPGARTCACVPGYAGDGITCAVDECATANGGCSANATCTNATGGRTCACNVGYAGDGVTCTYVHVCGDGICGPLEDTTSCARDCRVRAQSLAAGREHNCALLTDGTVRCWGQNDDGPLGTEDREHRGWFSMGDQLPRVHLGTGRTAVEVAAGDAFSCARLDDGSVKCWGDNTVGQLGQGDGVDHGGGPGELGDALPAVRLGTGRTARAIAAGSEASHACAILDDGSVKCWGENRYGQLGQGDTRDRGTSAADMGDALPPIALGTGRTARALALAQRFTCAILDDFTVKCWGLTQQPRPAGYPMGDSLPVLSMGPGRTARSIAAGRDHACAILDDDSVKCWGDDRSGQLGRGSAGGLPWELGAAIRLGTGRTALGLALGADHSCAILDDHRLKCWGENGSRQLGYPDTNDRGWSDADLGDALPNVDMGPGRTVLGAGAGWSHTCALLDDQTVRCWSNDATHAVGVAPGALVYPPLPIELGSTHPCGNAVLDPGEACDDGDARDLDGCSASCTLEPGWVCSGAFTGCASVCGDGLTTGAETCDDANGTAGDGCSACAREIDLRVTQATFSAPTPTRPFFVTETTCNDSDHPATAWLTWRVVRNGNIDPTVPALPTGVAPLILAAGPGLPFYGAGPALLRVGPHACETRVGYVLPEQYYGDIAVAAVITPGPGTADLNPANDFAVSGVLPVGPDVAVTAVSGPTAVPGQLLVGATVCNHGNAAITACQITARVSADATVDATDPYEASSSYPLALEPDECSSMTLSMSFAAVPSAIRGDAWAGVVATCPTSELDVANNAMAAPGRVAVGGDLAVTAVTETTGLGWVDVQSTVCNLGNVAASGTLTGRISADAVIDAADLAAGSMPVSILSPGQCAQLTTRVVLDDANLGLSGSYAVGALVTSDQLDLLASNDGRALPGTVPLPYDVCRTDNGGCSPLATCTVTGAGTRTCAGPPGSSGDGFMCSEPDPCLVGNGGCSYDAACTNLGGGNVSCACSAGYAGDGYTCNDVDECLTSNGGCAAAPSGVCTNTFGSRTCACAAGYAGDGWSCADVDECLTNHGGCSVNATCTNTPGSRTCTCAAGYIGDGVACTAPRPVVASVSPSVVTAGSSATTLTIDGSNFVSGAVAQLDGSAMATTFVSATQLTAVTTASALMTARVGSVRVVNPTSAPSGTLAFTVQRPQPTITSVSPSSATVGTGFTITVTGAQFVSGAQVSFNGAALATTFLSATTLTAPVSASLLSAAGVYPVIVTVPAPSAGPSAAHSFTVNSITPTFTAVSPASANVGAAATTVTLTGSGFATGMEAVFDGVALPAALTSANSAQVTIPASSLATARAASMTLRNAAPRTGSSAARTFNVYNPTASITSVSPATIESGTLGATLDIIGANFVAGPTVTFSTGSGSCSTLSATLIRCTSIDTVVAGPGSRTVTVRNVQSVAASSPAAFTVNSPVPAIFSMTPSRGDATSGNVAVTIVGNSFGSGTRAVIDGVQVTPSGFTNTQITFNVNMGTAVTARTLSVAVFNPAPGGGTSTPVTFTVDALDRNPDVLTGQMHLCRLAAAGTVRCAGYNVLGELGDGTTVTRTSPVDVFGLNDAVELAAGDVHSCARRSNGTVSCWGSNQFGQLGDGTTTSASLPVQVSGITSAAELSCGYASCCARMVDGTVRCWGYNSSGQLGTGNTTNSSVPVQVSGISDAAEVESGYQHACVRHSDGGVSCWGLGTSGQLGRGSATSASTPARISGLTGVLQLSSSAHHTCARNAPGDVRCWGRNNVRQLGDGTTTTRLAPVLVANNVGSVATGLSYTCVVSGVGGVRCAGGAVGASPLIGNGTGQGSGSFAATSINDVRRVLTGGINHVCAERRDGTVWCWGTNTNGVMGLGTSGGVSNSPVLTPF